MIKKPDVDWYINKMSDIFFERKIVLDTKQANEKGLKFQFTGKRYEKGECKVYGCVIHWLQLLETMEYIYNNLKNKSELEYTTKKVFII